MSSQVIYLRDADPPRRSRIRHRLAQIIAVFEEVDTQELLAALPDCPIARRNHLTALNMFLDVETALRDLYAEMAE